MKRISVISAVMLMLACSAEKPSPPQRSSNPPRKPEPAYTLPAPGTRSLVTDIRARRDDSGRVVVEGSLLLPRQTKIWVDVYRHGSRKAKDLVGESKTIVGFKNYFSAGPFEIPKAGRYDVQVTSYFNGPWQQPSEVVATIGDEGTKLPKGLLTPNDAEFPERGGHLNFETSVAVPALSPQFQAIEAVKSAKLYVKGKGQAVDTVAQIVDFFNKPAVDFHPGAWSATDLGSGKWKVSLQHRWGSEEKVANWEYNARTREIRYLDPEAKMLSWIPAE